MQHVRIGTRGSALALWQANWVKGSLEKLFPNLGFEIINIKTEGDSITNIPLERLGGEGIFVKQIETALLDNKVDMAVHSMKDLPTSLPDGLIIGAIPEREDSSDALVSKGNLDFFHLPEGSRIGTGSIRRRVQLLSVRRDIVIKDIRGNVDTRLAKLKSEDFDGIILASAGLQRLGYGHKITQRLPHSVCLPAVGQGALCIEIRAEDNELYDMVRNINHAESAIAVTAERAFLKRLGGGCRVPIAASGSLENGILRLVGFVSDVDGKKVIRSSISGGQDEAENVGVKLAEILLDKWVE